MDKLPPLGLRRPQPNEFDRETQDSHFDYLRTQRATQRGTFDGNQLPDEDKVRNSRLGGNHAAELGASVAKSVPPVRWKNDPPIKGSTIRDHVIGAGGLGRHLTPHKYDEATFQGHKELGHNYLDDPTKALTRDEYVRSSAYGGIPTDRMFPEGVPNRIKIASNGIQNLETGKGCGQIISASTPSNQQGRFWGAPESSIRSAMRGSTTNPGSNYHRPNTDWAYKQDDSDVPISVNQSAVSGGDDDDYGRR
jgi:hypothetical protein